MKWVSKKYYEGQTCKKQKFAWLPINAEDGHVYWLENVWVEGGMGSEV